MCMTLVPDWVSEGAVLAPTRTSAPGASVPPARRRFPSGRSGGYPGVSRVALTCMLSILLRVKHLFMLFGGHFLLS